MEKIYEVWEYGYGKGGRFRYKAFKEDEAVEKFLNRRIFRGESFQEYLKQDLKYMKIKVCVKNPFRKGTRKKPNYPEVRDVGLQ